MVDSSANFDFYVDRCLKKWALFCERCLTGGLGYPSKSVIAKIMEYGFLIQSSSAQYVPIPDSDDEIEGVESALISLSEYNPKLAKIIIIRYMYAGKLKQNLAKENISINVYNKGLQIARIWIASALRAKI